MQDNRDGPCRPSRYEPWMNTGLGPAFCRMLRGSHVLKNKRRFFGMINFCGGRRTRHSAPGGKKLPCPRLAGQLFTPSLLHSSRFNSSFLTLHSSARKACSWLTMWSGLAQPIFFLTNEIRVSPHDPNCVPLTVEPVPVHPRVALAVVHLPRSEERLSRPR